MTWKRNYPIGAEFIAHSGVHFRIWAPDHDQATLFIQQPQTSEATSFALTNEQNGYFSLFLPHLAEQSRYWYQFPSEQTPLADPASRYQPEGPFGPSVVVNPAFPWTDEHWSGVTITNQVIYEMHIGTFTPEGTFQAATSKLKQLAELGITLLEIMPINSFFGSFGWGYDGVNLFAPHHIYGNPNEVKAFINAAHHLGIGVILDIVYNHFGPCGNQLLIFTKQYASQKFHTDWGNAINFDEAGVREFFLTNARYWIEEFHFDGFRVDDTSSFHYDPSLHFLGDLVQTAKRSGGARQIVVIGENETQDTRFLQSPDQQGYGFDALWNDDFHHVALARYSGKKDSFYINYSGSAQEFVSLVKYGFLYQGQYYQWHKQMRGIADFQLPKYATVVFLENHDQLANTLDGKRLHQLGDPGIFRALTTYLLLGPHTPLLFQGQEFGASTPFVYFADQSATLNPQINAGRKRFLAQFARLATKEAMAMVPDPASPSVFHACQLHHEEINPAIFALHRDLLQLRKTDTIFRDMQSLTIDGAVLTPDAFAIRLFGESKGDRLLLINFGADLSVQPASEPLLAAGRDLTWELLWSSEAIGYGGGGVLPLGEPYWLLLARSAMVLKTIPTAERIKPL